MVKNPGGVRSIFRKPGISASCALVLTLAAGAAWAHHNMSALFDFNNRVSRTGTLSKMDWRNPHIYLSVDTKGDRARRRHGRSRDQRPMCSETSTSARAISRAPSARP